MAEKRVDRRIERSRDALRIAFIELVLEVGFEAVSVSALTERANVGRSTFYSHFADKEDLLQDSIDGLKDTLKTWVESGSQGDIERHPALAFSLPMIEHVGENRRLAQAFAGPKSGPMLREHMQWMLCGLVREGLAKTPTQVDHTGTEIEMYAEFVVGAFRGILDWWLVSNSKLRPDEVDARFRALVQPGLDALL